MGYKNYYGKENHKQICYDEEGSLECVWGLAQKTHKPLTDEELSAKLMEHLNSGLETISNVMK